MQPYREILALARVGATGRAWARLAEAGLDQALDDPQALTLKGRLLKDLARQAGTKDVRADYFRQACDAYETAAAVSPATYPLINAATMALKAGNADRAHVLAAATLELLESGRYEPETPYWLAATRAEAHLLLGHVDEARAALEAAIETAPQAWEDHATTLRQFALILADRGESIGWLKAFLPPPSLHFRGIIGIAADDTATAEAIDAVVARLKPGFAFGALAAGADILVAEAVLRQGGMLHVILPCAPDRFRAESVARSGDVWLARYDVLLDAAEVVDVIEDSENLSHAAIDLANNVALGQAIAHAGSLESRAVALTVGEAGRVFPSPWVDGLELVQLDVVRSHPSPPLAGGENLRSMAILHLIGINADHLGPDVSDRPSMVDRQDGSQVLTVDDLDVAIGCAATLIEENPEVRIGFDYAVIDPGRMDGPRFDIARRCAEAAAPGTIFATWTAALALNIFGPEFRAEPAGELTTALGPVPVSILLKRH